MNQKSAYRVILFGVAFIVLNANLCAAQLIDTTNNVTEEDGTAIADSTLDISVNGLRVGNTANGSMDVTGGLEVTHSGSGATGGGFIGFASGTNGTTTISGVNSRLTGQELSVGHFGNGELNVLAGGVRH